MSWIEARARFPVLEQVAYLNAGTFGPLSRTTVAAVAEVQRWEAERGRAGKAYFEQMLGLRESVRRKIAAVLGAETEQVALTTSTTDGCNVVLRGLGIGPDDEVVTTDSEHFGLVGPLAVSGARLRIARIEALPAEAALEAILAEVTPRTRLLALSHVTWLTGRVLPLAELQERTGLPILVDGAQGAGAIPVDATQYDYYTVSAQKWLCGPDSTGALFVRDAESLGLTAATYFSQESYDLAAATFKPRPGAPRFDGGWLPSASLAGLEAALTNLPDGRFERAAEMAAYCRTLLEPRVDIVTEPGNATLLSFRTDGDAAELSQRLYEAGIVIRDLPNGWARVSCGWWTNEEDLDRLAAALDDPK